MAGVVINQSGTTTDTFFTGQQNLKGWKKADPYFVNLLFKQGNPFNQKVYTPIVEPWLEKSFSGYTEELNKAKVSLPDVVANHFYTQSASQNGQTVNRFTVDWDSLGKEMSGYIGRRESWKAASGQRGSRRGTILTGGRGVRDEAELAISGLTKKLGG